MNNETDRWVELAERAQRVSILAGLIRIRQSERVAAKNFLRDRTVVVHESHKLTVPGSIPGPATSFPTRVVGGFKSSASGAPPFHGAIHNIGVAVARDVNAVKAVSHGSAGGRVGLSLVEHNRFPKGRW